jgi:hypothetical protein
MNGEGPVADFELEELRKLPYARGWDISRTDDGKVTALRQDGSAAVTVGSAALMKVALHNELWRSLTDRNQGAPEPEGGSHLVDDSSRRHGKE